MKLFCYIVFLAIASLLAYDNEWGWFWAYVVIVSAIIYFGNKKDNEYLDFN